MASLGAVESQILVVHPPADLPCLYLWWASLDISGCPQNDDYFP